MEFGIFIIGADALQGRGGDNAYLNALLRELFDKGFDVSSVIYLEDEQTVADYVDHAFKLCDCVMAVGGGAILKNLLGLSEDTDVVRLDDGKFAALIPEKKDAAEFFRQHILETLDAAGRTKYCTYTFKTYGTAQEQLAADLKDLIKNRKRITVTLSPSLYECDVSVKYSGNMTKMDVDYIIDECAGRLGDAVYSTSADATLASFVVDELRAQSKTVAIAESFTGGKLTSSLVAVPGASSVVLEGIVAYTEYAKQSRLGVDAGTLQRYSAVSMETAYIMAASLLEQNPADYCMVTTGYAGPTGAEVGKCIVGIGDRSAIHLFDYKFSGTRESIMDQGAKRALCHLADLLKGKIVT